MFERDVAKELRHAYLLGRADVLAELAGEQRVQGHYPYRD